MMRAVPMAAVLSLASVLLVATVRAEEAFEDCAEQLGESPGSEAGAQCYVDTAERRAVLEEAAEELAERVAAHPDEPWLRLYFGLVLWRVDASRVEAELRRAAAGFHTRQDPSGEIRARSKLVSFLAVSGQLSPSLEELERAAELWSDDLPRIVRLRYQIAEAHYLIAEGGNLEKAYAQLEEVAAEVFAAGSQADYALRRESLWSLGFVQRNLGLYGEAKRSFQRWLELAERDQRIVDLPTALSDLAEVTLASEIPTDDSRQDVLGKLRHALALAEEVGNREIRARALRWIAELDPGPSSRTALEQCLVLAEDIDYPEVRRECLLSLASFLVDDDREGARDLLAAAYAAVFESESGSSWDLVYGWRQQLEVFWKTAPEAEALDAAEGVLSAIEGLSRAQSGLARERLISTWADAYYWLSGNLLEKAPHPEGGAVDRAFAVMERLRERQLREISVYERSSAASLPPELRAEKEELDRSMDAVYRRLLDPDLREQERKSALGQLEELEWRDRQLRDRAKAGAPVPSPAEPPDPALLRRLQSTLGEDEVLLSFQLAPWAGFDYRFAGGSWLVAVTRGARWVYRLPELAEIKRQVEQILDFDWEEVPDELLESLYRSLVEQAVDGLPAGIARCILVPDGVLHLLPFAALRPSPEEESLAERFELSTVPSASFLLRSRKAVVPRSASSVLIVAAPRLPKTRVGAMAATAGRSWDLSRNPKLGPLPWARCEGRCVLGHLGGQLVTGDDASESFFKSVDFSTYSIVHFAAHAVVDAGRHPWRSGVVLAAQGEEQDGLLRYEEIADVPLDGKVVVLSICRSGVGEVLRGAGAMSLARAFFEAGARAVIATRRPLPDRGGAEFFHDFYRALGRGKSLRQALASTQRQWIGNGKAGEVWANVVLLGDGEWVPVPGGSEKQSWPCSWHPACWPVSLVRVLLAGLLLYGAYGLLRGGGRPGRRALNPATARRSAPPRPTRCG